MINAGESMTVNNCTFGYLSHRIVFYLLNLHIKSRHTYFARVSRISPHTTPYLTRCRLVHQAKSIPTKLMLRSRSWELITQKRWELP